VVLPSSMGEDEVCVLVFKPNISPSGAAFNPTSDHQQNPLQPGPIQACQGTERTRVVFESLIREHGCYLPSAILILACKGFAVAN
jgi:hypothetical protein